MASGMLPSSAFRCVIYPNSAFPSTRFNPFIREQELEQGVRCAEVGARGDGAGPGGGEAGGGGGEGGRQAGMGFNCSVEMSVDFSVEFLSLIN